jgi:hypothetical protein
VIARENHQAVPLFQMGPERLNNAGAAVLGNGVQTIETCLLGSAKIRPKGLLIGRFFGQKIEGIAVQDQF